MTSVKSALLSQQVYDALYESKRAGRDRASLYAKPGSRTGVRS